MDKGTKIDLRILNKNRCLEAILMNLQSTLFLILFDSQMGRLLNRMMLFPIDRCKKKE